MRSDLLDRQAEAPGDLPSLPPKLELHSSSALMQDVFATRQISYDTTSPSPVALFPNLHRGWIEEALVIELGGQLVHLKRTRTGWETAKVADHAKEVVVAISPDNVVWAFFTDEHDDLNMRRLNEKDTWEPDANYPKRPFWKYLKVTYSAPTPIRRPVVYGLHTQKNTHVQYFRWEVRFVPSWKMRNGILEDGTTLQDADVTIYPIADQFSQHQRTYQMYATDRLRKYDSVRYFEIGWGASDDSDAKISPFGLIYQPGWRPKVVTVVPVDRTGILINLSNFLMTFASAGGPAHVLDSYSWRIGGATFAQAKAMIDSSSLIHVYSISPTGILSVLHQTGWTNVHWTRGGGAAVTTPTWPTLKGSTAIFAPAIDENVLSIFVDPYPDSSPNVLIVKEGGLTLFTQDLVSGRWWTEPVRLSSSAAEDQHELSVYRTQVTLVDQAGRPVPFHKLRVSAESLVQVKVDDEIHFIGPTAAIDVTTNLVGRVVFSVPASGLTTPQLTITAPDLASGVILKADAPIQRYLAGTGTLPLKEKLTGTVLRQASVNGKPLVPKWDGVDPDALVKNIGDVFGAAKQTGLLGPQDGPRSAGFVIQCYDSNRPAHRQLATAEEIAAELEILRQHPSYGGIVEDTKQFLEDLWEGIKRGVVRLKAAIVNLAGRVAHLVVFIGQELVEIGQYIIDTVRDAAMVVMAMFNTLEASIQGVVDWLKSLFDWKAIWDAKTVLEDGVGRLAGYARSELLGKLDPTKIKQLLDPARIQVKQQLEQIRQAHRGQSFRDLPGWDQYRPKAPHAPDAVLLATPNGMVTRADIEGATSSWFWDAVLPYAPRIPGGPVVDSLKPIFNELLGEFNRLDWTPVTRSKDFLASMLSARQTDDLGRLPIDDVIDFALTFVDAFFLLIEGAARVLYTLVDKTLEAIGGLLGTKIDIAPLVSLVHWVHKQAHPNEEPKDLTIAGLSSLLIALPATLACKLVNGPNAWLFRPGASSGWAPEAGVAAGGGSFNPWVFVAGVAQVFYCIVDVINDVNFVKKKGLGGLAVGGVTIVIEGLMVMCVWPTPRGVPFENVFDTGENDTKKMWRLVNWSWSWLYLITDAGAFLVPNEDSKSLFRHAGDLSVIGQTFSAGFGTLNLITGFGESFFTGDPLAAGFANCLSPLSPFSQLLFLTKSLAPFKPIVTVLADVGGGASRMASAFGV
jgi:hypothetical protein